MMKTHIPGKNPREEAPVLQGFRSPAGNVTTSEPLAGNGPPGAPVIVPMSGFGFQSNQGGTVEYRICIPPLFFRGVGIFYASLSP